MSRARTAAALAACAALAAAPAAAGAPTAAERSLEAMAQRAEAAGQAQRESGPVFSAQGLIGTPGVFADTVGDTFLAPDLQQMVVGVDETSTLGVLIRLNTNVLIDGDAVFTYIDTDGSTATGSPVFDGADLAVGISGSTLGPGTFGLLRWNGTSMVSVPAPPSMGSSSSGTTDEFWSASLADLGIAPGTVIGVRFATIYTGLFDNYFDWSPEPGTGPFRVAIPVPAPPPPVTPAPPAPTPTTSTTPPEVVVDGTPPPPALLISGMSLRRVGRDVRVRLNWRGATTLPVAYRLQLRCRGRAKAFGGLATKGVPVSRRVRIPAACGKAPVQVRMTLTNGTHRVSVTRTVG